MIGRGGFVIIFGMNFKDGQQPDFGSIRQGCGGDFTLLAADISKLNGALTRTVCAPKLQDGSLFAVSSGAVAFVADWKTGGVAKAYMYEESSDSWYEFVSEW